MSLDRERICLVRTDKPSVGTGTVVGSDLVLTAAHLVHGTQSVEIQFDLAGSDSSLATGTVVWDGHRISEDRAPGLDLAVIRTSGIHWPVRQTQLRMIRRNGVLKVEAVGFPDWKLRKRRGRDDNELKRLRDSAHVTGSVHLLSDLRDDTFEVVIDDEPTGITTADLWKGMSGAAVWSDDCIVGVISEHHSNEGQGRLTAIPMSRLLDSEFAGQLVELETILGPEVEFETRIHLPIDSTPRGSGHSLRPTALYSPKPAGARYAAFPVGSGQREELPWNLAVRWGLSTDQFVGLVGNGSDRSLLDVLVHAQVSLASARANSDYAEFPPRFWTSIDGVGDLDTKLDRFCTRLSGSEDQGKAIAEAVITGRALLGVVLRREVSDLAIEDLGPELLGLWQSTRSNLGIPVAICAEIVGDRHRVAEVVERCQFDGDDSIGDIDRFPLVEPSPLNWGENYPVSQLIEALRRLRAWEVPPLLSEITKAVDQHGGWDGATVLAVLANGERESAIQTIGFARQHEPELAGNVVSLVAGSDDPELRLTGLVASAHADWLLDIWVAAIEPQFNRLPDPKDLIGLGATVRNDLICALLRVSSRLDELPDVLVQALDGFLASAHSDFLDIREAVAQVTPAYTDWG